MPETSTQPDSPLPFTDSTVEATPPRRVLIRASAGTGKTFRLSNWFLGELFSSADTAQILATTFTRKAAREILDRILVRLAEAALHQKKCDELSGFLNRPLTCDECQALLDKLTRELHRLRVSTLDSFFAQIATNCSLDLGLPPGWTIIDGNSDRELRREAVEVLLREEGTGLATQLQHFTVGASNRSVTRLIDDAVKNAYQTFLESQKPAWKRFPEYHPLGPDQLLVAIADLQEMELPQTAKGTLNKTWLAARDKALDAFGKEKWEAFIQSGIASKILAGEQTYSRKKIEPFVRSVFERLIGHARGVIIPQMAQQTAALFHLLEQFHAVYMRLKHERRWLTHDDITRHLAWKVGSMNLEQIAFRLDSKMQHLLLDEFQDTSLPQWSILEPFARQVTQNRPGRTFFCVGDVKQAIYSWRGGVAEIFDKVESQISGLEKEQLLESRRSSQAIIDTVNRLFGDGRLTELSALSDAEKLAVEQWSGRFEEHSTFLKELPGYCELRTAPLAEDPDSKDSAESISRSTQKQTTLAAAADRVADLSRLAPHSTIGILCRSNATIARLMFELRERHVEASEEGGNPLTDSAAVEAVLSLLTIADHPGNTVARFHVATSPVGALFDFTDHSCDEAAHELSRRLRREIATHGLHAMLELWSRRLVPSSSARDARRLEQLVALASRTQASDEIRTRQFVDVVRNERVQDPSTHRIRVMTIHKSKGLEFDIVVLPELDSDLHGPSPRVVAGRPDPTSPIERVSIYRRKEIQKLLPEDFQTVFSGWTEEAVTQSLCVLYVAITRARNACYMLIPPTLGTGDKLRSSLSGLLRKGLAQSGASADPDALLFETGDARWYEQIDAPDSVAPDVGEISEQSSIQLAPMPAGRRRGLAMVEPSELEGGSTVRINELLSLDRAERLERGTLLHRWFEEIEWLDEGPPDEPRLRKLAGLHASVGVNVDDEVSRFEQFLQTPTTVSLLSRRSQFERCPLAVPEECRERISRTQTRLEVHREWGFTAPDREGTLMTGIIDRLVLVYDAVSFELLAADIIDYKTDEIDEGQAAAESRADFYRDQMLAYRRAIGELYRLSQNQISARLLFVTTGAVCTVTGI
jgi:ATP-dependent helicase/nuclease subunit A